MFGYNVCKISPLTSLTSTAKLLSSTIKTSVAPWESAHLPWCIFHFYGVIHPTGAAFLLPLPFLCVLKVTFASHFQKLHIGVFKRKTKQQQEKQNKKQNTVHSRGVKNTICLDKKIPIDTIRFGRKLNNFVTSLLSAMNWCLLPLAPSNRFSFVLQTMYRLIKPSSKYCAPKRQMWALERVTPLLFILWTLTLQSPPMSP